MPPWSQTYRRLDSAPPGSDGEETWLSPTLIDAWWDEFLQHVPGGQFQQSSRWADYKTREGWSHHRVILTGATGLVGGFQVLWKNTRLGRIGYVSKGPVLAAETAESAESVVGLVLAAVKELGLRALILQPPDESQLLSTAFARRGFLPNRVRNVIRSTLLVNLTGGMAGVTSAMNATARSEVKQAQRRGTTIREGGADDLGRFFTMMAATCQR